MIAAVLEQQSACKVAALTGKRYTVPKENIRGKLDEFPDALPALAKQRNS